MKATEDTEVTEKRARRRGHGEGERAGEEGGGTTDDTDGEDNTDGGKKKKRAWRISRRNCE